MKRRIPLLIVIGVGILVLLGNFINQKGINDFVDNDATQWFDIIAAFALFLGSLNLIRIQFNKVLKRKKNWQYSVIAIAGFLFAIYAGFFFRGTKYVAISGIKPDSIGELAKIISQETNNDSLIVANTINIYTQGFEIPYKFKGGQEEKDYHTLKEIRDCETSVPGASNNTQSYENCVKNIIKIIQADIIKYYTGKIRSAKEAFIVPIDFPTLDSAQTFANKYSPNYSIDYSVYDYTLKIQNVSDPKKFARKIASKIKNEGTKIDYSAEIVNREEYIVPINFSTFNDAKLFSGNDSSRSTIDSTYYHYMLKLKGIHFSDQKILSNEIAEATTFYFADKEQTEKHKKLVKFKYDTAKSIKSYVNGYAISKIFMTEEGAKIFGKKIEVFGDSFQILSKAWGAHVQTEGSLFYWMFLHIITPLGATMFALLAFFVASASYRAFRIRNFEATLLLASGILLMIGRVPAGEAMTGWVMLYIALFVVGIILAPIIRDKRILFSIIAFGLISISVIGLSNGFDPKLLQFMSLPIIQDWIFKVPTTAGARAIMIGIALGIVGTSFRIIFGMERSFLGE